METLTNFFSRIILVVGLICWFLPEVKAQDSLYLSSSNAIISSWEAPKIMMSINYDGFIELTNDKGNQLIIDFANDTVKYKGYIFDKDSFADVFCWAIIKSMNESFNKQWEQLVHINNKYEEYKARLEPKYTRALELYLEQLGINDL